LRRAASKSGVNAYLFFIPIYAAGGSDGLEVVMKKRFQLLFINIIASLLLIALSLRIPVRVESRIQLRNVQLGYPIGFLTQDTTVTPEVFPYYYKIGSIWDNVTTFDPINFLLSILTVNVIIIIIEFTIYKIVRIIRNKKIKENKNQVP
jgi:hypothetical protein